MKKTISISVGIPAYNEGANIGYLLERLLAQKLESNIVLKEIIVISDGSTDTTVETIKSVKSPFLRVIEEKKRLGQQARQNQLLSLFTGDVLVIIEGDTLPHNNMTLNNLVTPFIENKNTKIGMVVGHAVSLPADTLVEKINVHGMKIKEHIFSEWKNGVNIYSASGHSMKALSRDFTAKLLWLSDVPEDSYSYLQLKQEHFKMIRRTDAKAYVKRAASLKDYITRNKKFVGGRESLKKYFPKKLIDLEFNPPNHLVIKHILLAVFESPFLTMLYVLESLLAKMINLKVKEFDPFYAPVSSTKNLHYRGKLL